MRMLCVVLLASGVAAAQECTNDTTCPAGTWCLLGPGCDEAPQGACVPETFATSGEYCGCDGQRVSWNRDGGAPFPRWQEQQACGYDAGVARTWRNERWADAFDENGLRRAPEVNVVSVQPIAASGCEGTPVKLTPAAGAKFPERKLDHHVLFGCDVLPISTWSAGSITLKLPAKAESGCFAVVEADEPAIARYRAACLLTAKGRPIQFNDGSVFNDLAACRADGSNRLGVLHKPQLKVDAFGANGLARWESETSLVSETQDGVSIDWSSPNADAVKLNGEPQQPSGTQMMDLVKKVTISATNRCGSTVRTIRGTTTRSPWASSEVDLEDHPDGVTLYLPTASDQPRTVGVKVNGGASAPATVIVPAGSTRVTIPVAPPPMPTSKHSMVQITVPGAAPISVAVTAQRPRGFADLHVHQFANLGFGGVGLYGDPNETPEQGLKDCNVSHGPNGGHDLLNWQMRTSAGLKAPATYATPGWTGFSAWPDATDYTHQQVHAVHLKEAWRGGLRLMVMMAVDNGTACGVARLYHVTGQKLGCDPTDSVRRQLDAARAFAAANSSWYQIVTTPAEARDAIAANKLAVVLGVEVDGLLNCQNYGGDCDNADADQVIQFLKTQQVSHVFPVHFVSNAFGGSALMNPLTASHDGRKEACSKPGYKFVIGGLGPSCNPDGLTDVGAYFVRELMKAGFIVDIDHESLHTRVAVETIATSLNNYPLVSGHSTFFEVSNGYMLSENTLRPETVAQVQSSGGMVGLITNQANSSKEIKQVAGAPKHLCGKSVEDFAQAYRYAINHKLSIGFGSDFNGFNGQPSGRRPDGCLGGGKGPSSGDSLVTYPFIDDAGEIFEEPLIGVHRYNVNTDGLAHIGMYPHFIEALRKLGFSRDDLMPLMTSADSYLRVWENVKARGQIAAVPAPSSSTGSP